MNLNIAVTEQFDNRLALNRIILDKQQAARSWQCKVLMRLKAASRPSVVGAFTK